MECKNHTKAPHMSDCQICGDMANSNIRNRGINDRHDRIWTTEK